MAFDRTQDLADRGISLPDYYRRNTLSFVLIGLAFARYFQLTLKMFPIQSGRPR